MKNSSDTIGNRTRDLPTCSAVPHPTAPPRAPQRLKVIELKKTRGKVPVDAWQVMESWSKMMAAVSVRMAGDRKTSLNYYRFP